MDSGTSGSGTSSSQSFAAGQWLVGSQIQPGTYRTSAAGCYWARQTGLGGTIDDIIANGSTSANGGYVTILATDRAFLSRCSWTLDSGTSGSGTSSSNTGTPTVGRIVSGADWAAYEITNPSGSSVLNHPSFTVTASTTTGSILIEGRNDKFPMLAPGGKSWMYLPFNLSLYREVPGKITLSRFERSNTRPSNQSEWPTVDNIRISNSDIQFDLRNNSGTLRLSGESIFYLFCLDSSGTPVFAEQSLTYKTLLPNGLAQISWPTRLRAGQCNSLSVVLGAVFSS